MCHKLPNGYGTYWLWEARKWQPRRHIRCPGGPHTTGNPGSSRERGGVGRGAGGALRDEPARDLEAPQGPRAGGAREPRPRCPAPSAAARAPRPRRGERVARGTPAPLGEALSLARQPPRGAAGTEARGNETT